MFWRAAGLSALAIGSFIAGPAAHATLSWTATVGGKPTGTMYASFDSLPLGTTGGSGNGIVVSFALGGEAVQGSAFEWYAPPYLSNDNGALFGDNTNGPDTTTYLTTALGTVTLSLPRLENYVGLLWGSVDATNTLNLYNGETLVGTLTGSQITATPNGDQGINGTYYVNIDSTEPFDTVVATSFAGAFEFDNVAFDPADSPSVPEPRTLAVLGVGLVGLGFARRRRAGDG